MMSHGGIMHIISSLIIITCGLSLVLGNVK